MRPSPAGPSSPSSPRTPPTSSARSTTTPRAAPAAAGAALARWPILAGLPTDTANILCALDDDAARGDGGVRNASWFRDLEPEADAAVLDPTFRGGAGGGAAAGGRGG